MAFKGFMPNALSEPKLMRLVREGIERLGNAVVKVPPASAYVFRDETPFFSLDIEFCDYFVLACESYEPSASDPVEIDALASAILDRIISASRQIISLSDLTSRTWEIGTRSARSSRTGMKIVDVRVETLCLSETYFGAAAFGTVARIQILSDFLQPEIKLLACSRPRQLASKIRALTKAQREREARLRRLRRVGADLEIDVIALAAMAMSNFDPVLAARCIIADNRTLEMPLQLGSGFETRLLFDIVGGRLRCGFQLTDAIFYSFDSVVIPDNLPATVLASLKGMLISDVVDHPILRGRSRISMVAQDGHQTVLKLRVPTVPLWLNRDRGGFPAVGGTASDAS